MISSFTILILYLQGSSGADCNNKAGIQLYNFVKGVNNYIGIVEVCGPQFEWNVICADDGLTVDGASNAVCRQKGHVGASTDFQSVIK